MQLSTTGWLVLIFLVLIVFIINVGLFSALRRKDRPSRFQSLRRAGQTLRRPWQDEDTQLEKLASAVAPYRSDSPEGESTASQPPEDGDNGAGNDRA